MGFRVLLFSEYSIPSDEGQSNHEESSVFTGDCAGNDIVCVCVSVFACMHMYTSQWPKSEITFKVGW